MKARLALVSVLLVVLASAAPVRGAQADIETAVRNARAVLTAPHFSKEEITKALVGALEASLSILPRSAATKDSASRLESVAAAMKAGGMLSDKSREDLLIVYKSLAGKAWEIPKEITAAAKPSDGIKLATKVCLDLVDSALVEWKAGRSDQAIVRLLSFVLLVITPIKA